MNSWETYIDESGDANFGEESSKTFFVCAVVLKSDEINFIEEQIEIIKKSKGFGEFKSSKLKNKHRRFSLIQALAELPLRIVSVHVKKGALIGNWFHYKGTFFKFVQRILISRITKLFGSDKVVLDSYGTQNYQDSLVKYLDLALQGDLFFPTVQIGQAKRNNFLQVADIIGGTLRKIENNELDEEMFLPILSPIWKHRITIPGPGKFVNPDLFEAEDEIHKISLGIAKQHLEANVKKVSEPRLLCLEYLYYTSMENPSFWVFTDEILNYLRLMGYNLKKEEFRAKILGNLRDEGVVIAGSRNGIKIPSNFSDLKDHIEFNAGIALPVLKRLKQTISIIDNRMKESTLSSSLNSELHQVLKSIG